MKTQKSKLPKITYVVRDREAGNIIEKGLTISEAKAIIRGYEKYDKIYGIFVPDFYEIAPTP